MWWFCIGMLLLFQLQDGTDRTFRPKYWPDVTKKGDLSKTNWGFSNTTWGSTNKDVNMIVLRRSMGVSPVNTFFFNENDGWTKKDRDLMWKSEEYPLPMEGFQARLLEGTQKIVEFQDLESCSQGTPPSYGTSPISKWFTVIKHGDFPCSYVKFSRRV